MLKIRASAAPWHSGIEILILDEREGSLRVVEPLDLENGFKEKAEYVAVQPTCNIRVDAAQQLMDELWNCGIRPSEGAGSAGAMAATQRHLKDMQEIAFGLLKSKVY